MSNSPQIEGLLRALRILRDRSGPVRVVMFEGSPLPIYDGAEYGPDDRREWGFEVVEREQAEQAVAEADQ